MSVLEAGVQDNGHRAEGQLQSDSLAAPPGVFPRACKETKIQNFQPCCTSWSGQIVVGKKFYLQGLNLRYYRQDFMSFNLEVPRGISMPISAPLD